VAPVDASSPSETSREEEIFESASGMLSLGGGKLTTVPPRRERVVDRVVERLRGRDPERRFGPCRTGSVPLPGRRPPAAGARRLPRLREAHAGEYAGGLSSMR